MPNYNQPLNMAFDPVSNPSFSGSLLPAFEDEEPKATNSTSSNPTTLPKKPKYVVVRHAMIDLVNAHKLNLGDEENYQFLQRIIEDIRQLHKMGPMIDEKSEIVEGSARRSENEGLREGKVRPPVKSISNSQNLLSANDPTSSSSYAT